MGGVGGELSVDLLYFFYLKKIEKENRNKRKVNVFEIFANKNVVLIMASVFTITMNM